MIFVDTCVLIDLAEDDGDWFEWSTWQLAYWSERGALVMSPMVFAEWSTTFGRVDEVENAMERFGLTWQEPPRTALFLAAQAHRLYRRRGGSKAMMLPDFLIGAHAALARSPILTRDRRRFTTYFPGLEIVAP